MKNCLYILLCSNNRYYIGSCEDLEVRLAAHHRGHTKSTKYVRPITLCFSQSFKTLLEARRAERWLKNQKSRVFLEALLKEGRITKVFD